MTSITASESIETHYLDGAEFLDHRISYEGSRGSPIGATTPKSWLDMRVPIKRILCPVDFSEYSARAYRYAESLAQHYRVRLFVLNVVEIWRYSSACFAPTADDYDKFRDCKKKDATEQLKSFVHKNSQVASSPELVIREGTASDCILSFAQQEAVNLIVIGTHGVSGFDRVVLGSVTEKVLRKAACSVLAVHGIEAPKANHGIPLHEILFCTDFSEYSDSAFDYALSVATEYKSNLTVIHVIDNGSSLNGAKTYGQLDRLISAKCQGGLRITPIVRVGRPYREISEEASEIQADLVIMAVHGRNALDSAVFGSTTYRVVCQGNCPVLAIHS